MNSRPQSHRQHSLRLAIVAGCAAFFAQNSSAQVTGTWNANASDNWSNAGRWTGGIPTDAGDIANITAAINATRTVTINTTSRTIGKLTIGDNNSTNSFTVAASGGGMLIFDSSDPLVNAVLTQRSTSNGDTISAPIVLNNSLDLTNASTDTLNLTTGGISAGTSGTKTITVLGSATGRITMSGVLSPGSGDLAIIKGNANNTLALTGNNTFGGGVTLNAGDLLLGHASALGTGPLAINGGTLSTSADLTMANNNTQTWNNSFAFGGSSDLNLGTGAVALTASPTVTIEGSGIYTIGGDISGAGFGLTTANAGGGNVITGFLSLNGTNTYDGGTAINGGLVRFNGGSALPSSGPVTIGVGGALSVSGAHTTLATWLADPLLATSSSGALSLAGASSSEDFDPSAAGFNALSLGSNLGNTAVYTGNYTPGPAGYFLGGGGGTIEFSNTNALTGANNVTLGNGGGGTVILSGDNDYTGTTTVNAGTLQIGKGGTTGNINPSNTLTMAAGTKLIFARTDTTSLAAAQTISGDVTVQINSGTLTSSVDGQYDTTAPLIFGATANNTTTGNLDLSGANATFGGLTSQTNSATPNTITVGTGKTLTINGNIDLFNTGNAVRTNNVTLTGGGSLAVNGATIFVGRSTGTTSPYASRATLDLSGLSNFTAALSGNLEIDQRGDNTPTNTSSLLLASAGATPTNLITAAAITIGNSSTGGTHSLVLGSGTNTLNANSINVGTGGRDGGSLTFADAAGTLKIRGTAGTDTSRADLNIGTGTANTGVGANMVVDLQGHSADLLLDAVVIGTQPRAINYTPSLSFDTGTLEMNSLTMATRGTGGSTTNGTSAGRTTTANFNIGGGSVNITNGVLKLGEVTSTSGNVGSFIGTADGVINIAGGTVTIGSTSGTAVTLGSAIANTAASGTLNFTGGTTTINGNIVRAGGAGTTAGTFNIDGGSVDLTAKALGDSTNPIALLAASGTLSNVGSINGDAGLTKTTAGTLTLAGTNTYTGATAVTEGKLVVDGSITSNTDISAGATLAGIGSITGSISNGGTIAPGNSIGTLTVLGDATFNDGSFFDAELGALNSSDLLNMTSLSSNLSLTSSSNTLNLFSTLDPGVFTIIDFDGARSGIFDSVTFNSVVQPAPTVSLGISNPGGFLGLGDLYDYGDFSVFYNDTASSVQVAITAIPEPSTLVCGGLALLGLTGVGFRRRRRRKGVRPLI